MCVLTFGDRSWYLCCAAKNLWARACCIERHTCTQPWSLWMQHKKYSHTNKKETEHLPIHSINPSRWHSVSKVMNIRLVVVVVVAVTATDEILVGKVNQIDGVDDARLAFLRTFILLFIFNICSWLSLIGRLFARCARTSVDTFESIVFSGFVYFRSVRKIAIQLFPIYYLAQIYINKERWYFDMLMFAKPTEWHPIQKKSKFYWQKCAATTTCSVRIFL